MLPYYFRYGDIKLPSYGLMIAIGIVIAVFLMSKNVNYRLRKLYPNMELSEINTRLPKAGNMLDFTIVAVLFGVLGGKLLYLIPNIHEVGRMNIIELINSGFVIYGGIIGGTFGAYLYCKVKKLDVIACFDIAVPFLALAQGFGRIGCFMAGCCYGRVTTSAIGLVFKSEFSQAEPLGVPLVPTQLISSFGNFVIFIVLFILSRKTNKKGIAFSAYMLLYSVGRFIIEFYRGDRIRGFVGNLSTSQFISIFVFAAGIITMFLVCRAKNNQYADVDMSEQLDE